MSMSHLPEDFISLMGDLLGQDEANQLIESLQAEPPVSIRISEKKRALYPNSLHSLAPIPWCPNGYYLERRPIFTGDSALHGGVYYVQEASSMLLYQIKALLGDKPITALDLCAAPGGKSTLLLDILPQGSVLLANEIVKHRANILSENLLKWGNPNVVVTNTTPASIGKLSSLFDLILVDAPCSGEGMFRKDMSARSEWNAGSPLFCASRQKEILTDIWDSLNTDGVLVYSTCTMNTYENEDIVRYIIEELGAEAIDLGDLASGVWSSPFSPYPCYRMMPHRLAGEGLFMAVFRKTSSAPQPHRASKKHKPEAKGAIPKDAYGWIKGSDAYQWKIQQGDTIYAYPSQLIELLELLNTLKLPILTAGIPIGVIKGRDCIPHTALALSTEINLSAFEHIELSEEQIIPYLSREAIVLPEELPNGIKLVLHRGIPLGFIKHLGKRSNNLYPQEWRIRHGSKIQQEWSSN